MSSNIVSFDFESEPVRVVMVEGEPWFVLADLCAVLGLSNPSAVASRIDEAALSLTEVRSGGQRRQATIVSEGGMYEVVIRSDKPEAVVFRRWITGTVLPEIRKTGSYGVQPALPQGSDLLALAVIEAQNMIAAKDEQIAELVPKADYVDTFVADEDLRIFRNVAKSLGMQETQLREDLIERGWIYREKSTRWSEKEQKKVPHDRYSAYADKTRYFTPVPAHDAPRFRGEVMHTLKITPAGAVAIARLYGKHIQAVEDVA